MILLALLLVVQVGVVVRDAFALDLAAREGAREAAVSGDDRRVRDAVRRAAAILDADAITIEITPEPSERRRGEPMTVRLSYVERLRVPVVDRFVTTELPLRATATMRLERHLPSPTPDAPS